MVFTKYLGRGGDMPLLDIASCGPEAIDMDEIDIDVSPRPCNSIYHLNILVSRIPKYAPKRDRIYAVPAGSSKPPQPHECGLGALREVEWKVAAEHRDSH